MTTNRQGNSENRKQSPNGDANQGEVSGDKSKQKRTENIIIKIIVADIYFEQI